MLSTGCSARLAFFTTIGVAARFTVRTGRIARRTPRGTSSRDRNPMSPPSFSSTPQEVAYPDLNVHIRSERVSPIRAEARRLRSSNQNWLLCARRTVLAVRLRAVQDIDLAQRRILAKPPVEHPR